MQCHQLEVRDHLDHLVYMVKETDPDGVELRFSMFKDKLRFKNTKPLLEAFDRKMAEGESNIRIPLLQILEEYEEKLENRARKKRWSRGPVRPLNLYILTDGVWQPHCDATEIISDMVNMLTKYGVRRENFGIQFIRFGNDADGIARLEKLDSGLGLSMYVLVDPLPPHR